MKHIFFIIAVFLGLQLNAQLNKKPISYITIGISGAFDGAAEANKFGRFGKGHPYWDAKTSWQRKWKNGRIEQGEAFPLSSTVLVRFTDGYHQLRGFRNDFMLVTIAFLIADDSPKRKWYWYALDAAVHMLIYKAGFSLTYYLIK